MQDLTAVFAADFTAAPTTVDTTAFLLQELRNDMEANHAAGRLPNQALPRFEAARNAINTPNDVHEMRFALKDGVAGNLAGAISPGQRGVAIGALPSPVEDLRAVDLQIPHLEPNPDGSFTVTAPSLEFVVQDTIDFCPGNCGGTSEIELATIPLSRFEATGLSGDVPFVIRFPAPPDQLVTFIGSSEEEFEHALKPWHHRFRDPGDLDGANGN